MVTGEEVTLWREAMRDAKVLPHQDTTITPAPAPAPAPPVVPRAPRKAKAVATVAPSASDRTVPRPSVVILPAPRPSVPQLDHRRSPGLDKSTAGRFAKGVMEIDATIDLHGLTQPVAHAALLRFIVGSADLGRRCLLVITGKGNREGSGILRAEVPRWLNEPGIRGLILAFTHAQPKHGGTGALYVLLKRRR
jgi:DNA-nicking Smr family endonuclease